jgi:hypothetical protein
MNAEGIKAIVDGSGVITNWSLALFGATLAALIGTSYVKPVKATAKLMYLLYIPSWFFLAASIYYGDLLSRRGIKAIITPQYIEQCEEKMNNDFTLQHTNFNLALICLGVWLLFYLIWWIFNDWSKKDGD